MVQVALQMEARAARVLLVTPPRVDRAAEVVEARIQAQVELVARAALMEAVAVAEERAHLLVVLVEQAEQGLATCGVGKWT